MRYCGCRNCKDRGEVNPHELFEEYLTQQAIEFEQIFKHSYTVGEMTDLYDELDPKFENLSVESEIPMDLNLYWVVYGGSIGGFLGGIDYS